MQTTNTLAGFDRAKLVEAFMALQMAREGQLQGFEPDGRLVPLGDGQSAMLASEKMLAGIPTLAFSPEQVAKITPLCRSYIFEQVSSGALPSRKIGKRRVILGRDLVKWLRGESQAE
jgi:hypothetical protein